MFKKQKQKVVKNETTELDVPIPPHASSGPIDEEFEDQFELEGQIKLDTKESHNPYEQIMELANKNETERPKKFYKNNISLWTPGGIKNLAWFVNGTDSEGPVKEDTKGNALITSRSKCLLVALGLSAVFLVAVVTTLMLQPQDSARSVIQSPPPTFLEEPDTPAPVGTFPPDSPTSSPVTSNPTQSPSLFPTQSPTGFPTVTTDAPTVSTGAPTVSDFDLCSLITDDTRWKFCIDDTTLAKCEFKNGEGSRIPGETDCLKKSSGRNFCRCPGGGLFLETYGCVVEKHVDTGCVTVDMVRSGFVLTAEMDVP